MSGCSKFAAPRAQQGGLGPQDLWDKATGGPETVVPIPLLLSHRTQGTVWEPLLCPSLGEQLCSQISLLEATPPRSVSLSLVAVSTVELTLLFRNSWGTRQDLGV